MHIHTDNRRTIYDWAEGNFKSSKAVIIHERIAVGDHYHKNKDEEFFLLKGTFLELQVGNDKQYLVQAPHKVFIPRGTYHKFICEVGSILLGTATELYDENDEIRENNSICK